MLKYLRCVCKKHGFKPLNKGAVRKCFDKWSRREDFYLGDTKEENVTQLKLLLQELEKPNSTRLVMGYGDEWHDRVDVEYTGISEAKLAEVHSMWNKVVHILMLHTDVEVVRYLKSGRNGKFMTDKVSAYINAIRRDEYKYMKELTK